MLKTVIFAIPVFLMLLPLVGCQQQKDNSTYAPLPKAALGPDIPKKGYLVEEIKDRVYWVSGGPYQALIVATGDGVIIVDAPPIIGKNMLNAVSDVTNETVKYFIYSHSHTDHVGAAGVFPKNTIYIAHEKAADRLEMIKDPNRPVPSVTFSDNYVLKLGNQRVELSYKGVNHEPGSIFIYLPEQKVLMLVDMIWPGWVPFKRFGLAEDVKGYFDVFDQVLEYDFDYFVGGHLTRWGNRQDVLDTKEYVMDIKASVGKALQTVDFMAIAKKTGFENKWLWFKTYFDTVAETCAKAVVPNWIDRLGGADVFTVDNCEATAMHFFTNASQ